jgi:proline iminopeptidase
MKELYPPLAARQSFHLRVDQDHEIYVEESGNPQGIPVLFLHGGPGSGCNENHRRYFDPRRWRIVIHDQRGANRSRPRGATDFNTTDHLLADIERIRDKLGIGSWVVFGGSWGATLGLLYAQRCPQRVLAMILRGAFLARRDDLEWFTSGGASRVFPDRWEQLHAALPEAASEGLVEACHRLLNGPDAAARQRAAQAWSTWAGAIVTWLLPPSAGETEPPDLVLDKVGIEVHYARNRYFIAENQVLRDVDRLPRVPIRLVHGRRDLTCTLDSSWRLHRAIAGSELEIVRDGGHLAGEPVMIDALVRATDEFAARLETQ